MGGCEWVLYRNAVQGHAAAVSWRPGVEQLRLQQYASDSAWGEGGGEGRL